MLPILFCLVAYTSAIHVGYIAPATSYVYRSDNDGPANIIQVGAHGYQPAPAFAAPIVQPLKAVEAYDLAPVPLPYIAAKPIVVQDAEEDDGSDEADESSEEDFAGHGGVAQAGGLGHGGVAQAGGLGYGAFGHEAGGGSSYGENHHNAHGEKGSKGYHTKDHSAKGAAGNYGKQNQEGFFHEAKGEKGSHHDEADAHGKHYEAGKGYKGGDHGHKKHFSKGEDVTGYHKIFHKDEYKKDHDFYDVADKGGNFKKHGYQEAHHGSEEGAHKKGGHADAGFNKGGFGKGGFHDKGHLDEAEVGHKAKEGVESHYNHQEDYGKKGGSSDGKEYAFGGAGGHDEYDNDDSHGDDDE